MSSLPVYVFAFTCAQNLFSVHNELKNVSYPSNIDASLNIIQNTQARMNTVIGTSIGSAAVIYETIGLLGYLTFGTDVRQDYLYLTFAHLYFLQVASNILESYHNSALISICRLGIVIMVLFSYPLQLHPCRASLDKVFSKKDPLQATSDHGPATSDIGLLKYVGMTSGILLTSFLIALQVTQLEVVCVSKAHTTLYANVRAGAWLCRGNRVYDNQLHLACAVLHSHLCQFRRSQRPADTQSSIRPLCFRLSGHVRLSLSKHLVRVPAQCQV